jgi:hypothetical protein
LNERDDAGLCWSAMLTALTDSDTMIVAEAIGLQEYVVATFLLQNIKFFRRQHFKLLMSIYFQGVYDVISISIHIVNFPHLPS